jgi:hypothetical protein
VGKSRLAREAERQQLSTFRGRVWVADLSNAKTVEALCLTQAERLQLLDLRHEVEHLGLLLRLRHLAAGLERLVELRERLADLPRRLSEISESLLAQRARLGQR